LETVSAIATTGCSSALADGGNFLKMVSVQRAGMSGSKFLEQSLSTRKGQSAMILSSPKAAIREVALTTHCCPSQWYIWPTALQR